MRRLVVAVFVLTVWGCDASETLDAVPGTLLVSVSADADRRTFGLYAPDHPCGFIVAEASAERIHDEGVALTVVRIEGVRPALCEFSTGAGFSMRFETERSYPEGNRRRFEISYQGQVDRYEYSEGEGLRALRPPVFSQVGL